MTDDRIVAVALLTQRNLNVLGQGLGQSYRVHGAQGFEDLLAQLDGVEPVSPEPATWGMMIFGFGAIGLSLRTRKKAAARPIA